MTKPTGAQENGLGFDPFLPRTPYQILPASGMVSAFHRQPTRPRTKPRIRQAIHRLVNHFLETPPHDEVRSGRPPLTLGATGTGDERVRDAVCGTVSKKGRVLLLETDPCFRDAISDCLIENGYKVVAVANTQQASSEIMAGDFALVLYDPMMPGMSGEMFYRAVSRIDPDLCERFVFMSDDRHDAATNEFKKNINGFVLKKPFDVSDLLCSLALAELQGTFHSVFERTSTDPADVLPAGGGQLPEESVLREKVCSILARAETLSGPLDSRLNSGRERPLPHRQSSSGPSDAPLDSEPQLRARGMFRSYALAALALPLGLAAGLWAWYTVAHERAVSAVAEYVAYEEGWDSVSRQLEAALAVRTKLDKARRVSALLEVEHAKPRWTPVLRNLVPPLNSGVEMLEVQAHTDPTDSGACRIRVKYLETDTQPKLMAAQFRRRIEEDLKAGTEGRSVSTLFEKSTEAVGGIPERVPETFVVTATLGPKVPPVTMSKEGR